MNNVASSRHERVPLSARVLQGMGVWGLLGVLLVVGTLVSPNFLKPQNLLGALQMVSLLGILACGMAFVTYSGHFADLSAPAIMSLAGFAAISALPFGFGAALVCGLAAGLIIGLVNGWVIGGARVNPIIWTLAMNFLLDGVLRAVYAGNQVYPDASRGAGVWFLGMAEARIGPFPLVTLAMLFLLGIGHLVLRNTRFGGQTQLTGAAPEVARLSGVPVSGIVARAFLISAFAAALAGIFATSLNKLGGFEVGRGADFEAVTAIVLGGVALRGGTGSLLGVLGGVAVIGLGGNIMDLLGWPFEWKQVVTGAVFIGAVAATSFFTRRAGGEA